MVLKGLARSVAAKEVAAARITSKRGPLGAATRSRKTMIMTRTTSPGTTSFQKATEAMCVDSGASLHTSHHQLKQWAHEVTAAEPSFDAQKPLKWSRTPIVFDSEDHPDHTTAVG